jgi:serine phosphatase RsbU (regulator of sigma subunit)
MRIALIWCLLVYGLVLSAQDTIRFEESSPKFNVSIANEFGYYIDEKGEWDIHNVMNNSVDLGALTRCKTTVQNIDFTTSTYWVHFVLTNETDKVYMNLVLETGRPITNEITLFEIDGNELTTSVSGDGMPFDDKTIQTSRSVFPIFLSPNSSKEFWLRLSSDGEIISLPMIFWKKKVFEKSIQRSQFLGGLYYGVFLFVILIYFTFYIILRDVSFLIYTLYVTSTGLLQFSMDGYMHEFIFTSGGYFTQHIVPLAGGFTGALILLYTKNYLKLSLSFPRINILMNVLLCALCVSILLSLIPGFTYEISYPMVNGFSMIGLITILLSAVHVKSKGVHVSVLFLLGMSVFIIGAAIFILGNFSVINAPNLTRNALKVGTLLEIICLSILMAGKYKTLQEEKEEAQKQLLIELEGINERLEHQVAERTKVIEQKSNELEEKNDDIMASIKYAERIQRAILPSEAKFKTWLPTAFVLFKPRDVVSGDFYWMDKVVTEPIDGSPSKNLIIYATADCTGHGVPGAFVSIVGDSLLRVGRTRRDVNTPGEVLDFLNEGIYETFNSQFSKETIRDGMDIALCAIDFDAPKLYFSGAKNPVYIVRNNEVLELKGDKRPIGLVNENDTAKFINQEMDLIKGDIIYTFSDGYADQFGGPKGKKFMYGKLKKLLLEINGEPMEKQREVLDQRFMDWKGSIEQLDDILLIGVKI